MKEKFAKTLSKTIVKVDLKTERFEKSRDLIAIDRMFNVYIKNKRILTTFASPSKLKELAIGYLLDEGIVGSKEDILNIQIRGLEIKIKIKDDENICRAGLLHDSIKSPFLSLNKIKPQPNVKVKVSFQKVLQFISKLEKMAMTFKVTGGTHSAAIFQLNGKMVSFAEDVGRHNTIDKVIGNSVLSGVNLSRCLLVSTARQSASMVLKAARVGIPIVVSKASPLFSGVYVAEKTGITLICFARGHRMNIYTHLERVI